MNQLYRLLHTPPACLLKTLAVWKETYAIALRPVPTAPGCDPLPALGQGRYTCLPGTPGHWYTDPQLFARAGKRWLFCEDFDLAANKGAIAAMPLPADGRPGEPRTLLQGKNHLTFPTVFEWNGEVWLIPGTGEDRTLCLYRCRRFPDDWELARSFPVGMELAGTILLDAAPEALTLLSSQRQPEGGPAARLRRFTLRPDPATEGGFALEEDEPFGLEHRAYGLDVCNAGPLFCWGGQQIRPARGGTRAQEDAYLQFWARRDGRETPLCAATPRNIEVEGVDPSALLGIRSYCRDEQLEVLGIRCLARPR